MHLRYTLLALLTLAPLSLAEAQTCLGSVASGASPRGRNIVVAGTADFVEGTNTLGGRIGLLRSGGAPPRAGSDSSKKGGSLVRRAPQNRDVAVHIGVRSFSVGETSVVSADYQLAGEIRRSDDQTRSTCIVGGLDAINVSDADNGFINFFVGPSYGRVIQQGTTTLVPFGLAAANLSSAGESEYGEFSLFGEIGVGVRLNGGLTATGSVRRSFQDGAVNVLRVLVAYPLGGSR